MQIPGYVMPAIVMVFQRPGAVVMEGMLGNAGPHLKVHTLEDLLKCEQRALAHFLFHALVVSTAFAADVHVNLPDGHGLAAAAERGQAARGQRRDELGNLANYGRVLAGGDTAGGVVRQVVGREFVSYLVGANQPPDASDYGTGHAGPIALAISNAHPAAVLNAEPMSWNAGPSERIAAGSNKSRQPLALELPKKPESS